MPDVTPQEQVLEMSIPADEQSGLPIVTPAAVSGEMTEAGANSNPQSELATDQPQNNNLSTSDTQILCGLEDCKESFETFGALQDHMRAVHKKKSNAGRPCTYCENSEKYNSLTQDYLKKSLAKTGEKVAIPFIEELALSLDKDDETLKIWADKKLPESEEYEHPEFRQLYKRIMSLQKLRLLQRTLGRFNPTGAIFQLKVNHGLVETEKKVLTGDAKEPLLIEFVGEKPTLAHDE